MNKEEKRAFVSEQFYNYFCNCVRATGKCVLVQPVSVRQYMNFLKPETLFEYNPERWKDIESIYDITDKNQLIDMYDEMMASDVFKSIDNRRFRQTALANYITFFRVIDFFNIKQEVNLPKENPYEKGNNTIYYGAPGTGKSHHVKERTDGHPHWRVTFHPDTDYASFVGCYKPTMIEEKVKYTFVPQTFLKAYVAAWRSYLKSTDSVPPMNYLIIEELNRGNCAQIFGDLFQLLDRKTGNNAGFSTYTIQADTDIAKHLERELSDLNYLEAIKEIYKDEFGSDNDYTINEVSYATMALPSNFSILATMNTSDQSLYPMDSAFKRRWEWIYIPINTAKQSAIVLEIGNTEYQLSTVIDKINDKVKELLQTTDKQLGEWFLKIEDNRNVTFNRFRDKVLFYLFNDAFKDDSEFSKLFLKDPSSDEIFLFEDLQVLDGDVEAEIEAQNCVRRFLKAIGVEPMKKTNVQEQNDTTAISELDDSESNNN